MTTQFVNPTGLFAGTFSHVAIVSGGRTVHISGQVAFDETGRVVGSTFAEQAQQVFSNLRIALAAAGAEFRHIVKMNIYVRDLTAARLKTFREIRQQHLGAHQPASTLVGTPALVHEDLMLEIEVVAIVE
jgi:enamine deaminase RidA (YjgF/YER057c/UK114 family)